MKSDQLKIGDVEILRFRVTEDKTVPALYPEAPDFQEIPPVFASGFMIGLMEWCCINALKPVLEDGEGSLGILVCSSHEAPTPVGGTVTVTATVSRIDGPKFYWTIVAHDDLHLIGKGEIGRAVVEWDTFNQRLERKRQRITEATMA